MKRMYASLFLFVFMVFIGFNLTAQCEPDTENCIDTDEPGQFCPMILDNGVLNVAYEETITVIPPNKFEIEDSELSILYIQIDSVKNLPPGIDYFPNADTFYAENAYCIQLEGTPTQTGEFTLSIYITATVFLYETEIPVPVVDDSSIVLTVDEFAGIIPGKPSGFRVEQNVPNPFTEVTRLSCYTPGEEQLELSVYNILGVLVHREKAVVPPGEHTFGFDGGSLDPGTYIFKVNTREKSYSRKLVKSK